MAGDAGGTYRYNAWTRASGALLLVGPVLWVGYYLWQPTLPTFWIRALVAIVLAPALAHVAMRWLTASVTIDDDSVHFHSLTSKTRIAFEEITDVRLLSGSSMEAVYVRGRDGSRICIENGLDRYEEIRDFLVRKFELNNAVVNEALAQGRHTYSVAYKIIVAAVLAAIWFGFAAAITESIWKGTVTSDDVTASVLSVLFLTAGILGPWRPSVSSRSS